MGKKSSLHFLLGTCPGLAALVYVSMLLSCDIHVSYLSDLVVFKAMSACFYDSCTGSYDMGVDCFECLYPFFGRYVCMLTWVFTIDVCLHGSCKLEKCVGLKCVQFLKFWQTSFIGNIVLINLV